MAYHYYLWQALESHLKVSLLVVFLSILALLQLVKRNNKLSNKVKKLPSPPKLPVIGNLHQLGHSPHRKLDSIAKRYGSLMRIHLGTAPVVVVSSGNAVHEMVKRHDIALSNRQESIIYKRLMYNCKDLLLAPYGEYWRQMRGVCFSQLLSPKQVESLQSQCVREQETSLLMEKIYQFGSSPFDLSNLFECLTKDILYIAAIDKRFSTGKDAEDKLTGIFIEFNALLGVFNIGDYIPWLGWINHFNGLNKRVEKNHQDIDELLEEVIDARLLARQTEPDGPKEKVLLDALLDVQNGSSVTRDSIKAVILDVFAGGIDTTFVVLEWAMAELLRHPEMLKRAQDEVRKIVGNAEKITKTDLVKMNYLKAVIKESMRLHPPFPLIPRVSSEEIELQGHIIPSKTRFLLNIWAVGRDPEFWEKPDEFMPERFLGNGGESVKYNSQDYSWMALGAGRRGCPGGSFGMSIIEFVIASLLHNFNWALPDGKDLDMHELAALALHKLEPLVVVATPHCNA